MYSLEISKKRALAEVEAKKFGHVINAIGADTVKTMAQAGPEMQTKLLQSLGLKTVLFTSGNAPINLFNTASGLNPVNPNPQPQQQ